MFLRRVLEASQHGNALLLISSQEVVERSSVRVGGYLAIGRAGGVTTSPTKRVSGSQHTWTTTGGSAILSPWILLQS